MITAILMATLLVVPLVAIGVEWIVSPGISEHHHGSYDTYVISHKMTRIPVVIMTAASVPGIALGVLRITDLFNAREAPLLSFFASFVLVTFVMWIALRRYKVTTYDDRMRVRPFVGRDHTVRYDDIERLRWSAVRALTNSRNLSIVVDGRVDTVLVGFVDLDQILLRVNRDDVIEWER